MWSHPCGNETLLSGEHCGDSPIVGRHLGDANLFIGLPRWLKIHLPTQETQVQSLGQEDPLEKEMATHSSILAWRIPWTEDPGGLQFMGSQKSWTQVRD